MKESPIFLKTHDMILWLLQHTTKFPKSQRFVMARRIEDTALDFYDHLIAAGKNHNTLDELGEADVHLERLRHHIRMCRDLKLFSISQFEHCARQLVEIGKLLGAWLKKVERVKRG